MSKLHLPTLSRPGLRAGDPPGRAEAITRQRRRRRDPRTGAHLGGQRRQHPLKVIASPYREITRPVLDYVKRITKESPRTVVTVFIPSTWWGMVGAGAAQPERAAAQGAAALRAERDGDFGTLAAQLVGAAQDHATAVRAGDARRGSWIDRTDTDRGAGGQRASCVARHDGRVVFVRYALPGEVGGRGWFPTRIVLERRGCRGGAALRRSGGLAVHDRRAGRFGLL